jgi:hypothetical protein
VRTLPTGAGYPDAQCPARLLCPPFGTRPDASAVGSSGRECSPWPVVRGAPDPAARGKCRSSRGWPGPGTRSDSAAAVPELTAPALSQPAPCLARRHSSMPIRAPGGHARSCRPRTALLPQRRRAGASPDSHARPATRATMLPELSCLDPSSCFSRLLRSPPEHRPNTLTGTCPSPPPRTPVSHPSQRKARWSIARWGSA